MYKYGKDTVDKIEYKYIRAPEDGMIDISNFVENVQFLLLPDAENSAAFRPIKNLLISNAIFQGFSTYYFNIKHYSGIENAWIDVFNVYHASLPGSIFVFTKFNQAHLMHSDLTNSIFDFADLSWAVFIDCDLTNCSFRGANLTGARFEECIMYEADFSGAINPPDIPTTCPSHGEFVGWKKCFAHIDSEDKECYIVKLLIPEDAQRSSATGRKCRCSKAIVLDIQNIDPDNDDPVPERVYSWWIGSSKFYYKVGMTVTTEEPFEEDRYEECASGIHFFVTRQEAVNF